MWQWRMSCVTMNWSLIRPANKKTPPRLINFIKKKLNLHLLLLRVIIIFFFIERPEQFNGRTVWPEIDLPMEMGSKCTSLSRQPKEKHEMLIFMSWSQHRHLCMWSTLTVIIWITQEKCNPVDGGRSLIDLISKKKCTEKQIGVKCLICIERAVYNYILSL